MIKSGIGTTLYMDITCENKAAILLKRNIRQKIIGHTNNENDVNGDVNVDK